MSEEDEGEEEYEEDEDGEGEDEDEAGSGGGLSGKQIVLFVAVPLLLICGIGAGLYFSGVIGGCGRRERRDGNGGARAA